MNNSFQLKLLAALIGTVLLSGCGDAETNIVEREPIIEEPDDHDDDHGDDDDHDHGDGLTIESLGRLAVLSSESNEAVFFDLDDGTNLGSFALTHESNRLKTSAGYRYALISSRSNDHVGFIDGGLWREDHGDHLHDYEQAPALSDYTLTGSRPTHVVNHDGQTAVFYDGNAEASTVASVHVFSDSDITNETSELPTVTYNINMHGVAEPRGEHLLATFRRDDAESTSSNKILPDQVAVYHLHDGEYEQEQILEVDCPDLHGAAQNHEFVAFGCSDGVLVAHQHDDEYEASKIANNDDLDGLRVGTLYGHEESESFIGIASQHGGGSAILVQVEPEEGEMETIDWQPLDSANPVSYGFSHEGEFFAILDNQGYLTLLSQHEHDGHQHWEFESRIDISEEDVADMPEGLSFSMTLAQNGHFVYVSDPIAQHILQIDLEDGEMVSDIELTFAASSIAWLGIPEAEHDHDHD